MTDIDITTLDLAAYSKKERKELMKRLEELERGPAIDSNDERIKGIAETVRGIAAKEKITTTDVVLALGKNLRIRIAVEKRPRKEAAGVPGRRKKAAGIKARLVSESFDAHVLLTTDVGSRRIAPM